MNKKDDNWNPEELMWKKFRVLCKFRALVRLVRDNVCWLEEDYFLNQVTERVRKSVIDTFMKISSFNEILSLEDKMLLYKPISWRNESDKKYLYRLIGGLKFFRQFPKNTRRKLASVTIFRSYGPIRVLLKEGHMPQAVYFIVAGEVQKKDRMGLIDCILKSGDMMGLEELYYDEPYTSTYISISPVQLLFVEKENFETMLSLTLQKHWSDVRNALSLFTYFSDYSERTIREAFMYGKVKTYKTDDVIYGDGYGDDKCVYFIISGKCQIIETLLVRTITAGGKKYYTLHKQERVSNIELTSSSSNSVEMDEQFETRFGTIPEFAILKTKGVTESESKPSVSIWSKSGSYLQNSTKLTPKVYCYKNLPKDVKLVFMQVGFMSPGGCFNLGEKIEERRIVSVDDVRCLLLPRAWLWKKNHLGFWNKIKWYLEKNIPSKMEVFKKFKVNRQWESYKEDLIDELLTKKKAVNVTNVCDVPYSVRIDENFTPKK